MNNKSIKLDDKTFFVEDRGIAKNYSNVSDMFRFFNGLELTPEPVIFDVGANIGMFTLSYATLFQDASVYSFEPVPFIYSQLNKNIQANKDLFNRINTFNFGFSDVQCSKELSIPSECQHERYDKNNDLNCGLFSVHGEGEEKFMGHFLTVDGFISDQQINHLDFIKIDVEGHEFEVLEGAKKTISDYQPIVFMEFNELTRTLSGHTTQSFENFFTSNGYLLFGLEYGWKEALVPLNDLNNVNNISDIIGIHAGKLLPNANF